MKIDEKSSNKESNCPIDFGLEEGGISEEEDDNDELDITDTRNIGQSMVIPAEKGNRGKGRKSNKTKREEEAVEKGFLSVQYRPSMLELELWNIYGPTNSQEKAKLWEEIESFVSLNRNKKLIIGGDFNVILDLADKHGGIRKITREILDFKNFV
ncbi:hypothetical protein SUGI_0651160 [Cryptomeria japonica]|nr:hypothetical protein SUGI_0651160 [Cryptomeria japonica]